MTLNTKQRPRLNTSRRAGFTIVEVLISMVIVSLALLSSIAMQTLSKRSNFDAAQRTTAAHLAGSLLERMRNNPDALLTYITAGDLGDGSLGLLPPTDCTLAAADCTADQLAGYDLWEWEQLIDGRFEMDAGRAVGGLLNPTACIRGPGFGGNGVYVVAIAWRGMANIGNPVLDNCGVGLRDYGDNNANRRLLFVQTFISAT